MDRHCSCYSPYQPSATQVYLDYLRLTKQDENLNERSKAQELSLRPLSTSELEEHHKRKACLFKAANDRHALAFTVLHQCNFPPPAMGINGSEHAHRKPLEEIPQQCESQRKPIAFPPHLADEDHGRRQILRTNGQPFEGVSKDSQPSPAPRPPQWKNEEYWQRHMFRPSRDQRWYTDFELAGQKRRMARMGLASQDSCGEGTTSQTAHSPQTPKPTNHRLARTFASKEECVQHLQEQSKAQQQQSENPDCGLWVRDQAERRKLAEQKCEQQKREQQKREQQKKQLPAAKPGSLYPGPTRIPNFGPPHHFLHGDHKKQSRRSELTLSIHLKSKMASQGTDRDYKEEKERTREQQQQPKATLWAPRPEATRTEPVRQPLDGVNKDLKQKVDAVKAGAAKTERVENQASRAHSQQPHTSPEDRYEAGLKSGTSFSGKYDKSYPMSRPLYGTRCSSSLDPASVQPLTASPDHPAGNEVKRHTGTPQKEVTYDFSRTSGFRAAVEAIDRTSGHLLQSPRIPSDQDKVRLLEPSGVVVSPSRENGVVGIADISLVTFKDHPTIVVPRQDAPPPPPPPTPQAEQTDMGTEIKEDNGGIEDVVRKMALEDVDIHLEWQEVEHCLEDDGWSDVEQDFADDKWSRTSSSLNLEWTSDVVSEGAV